jgi:hypothetical protein
VLSEFPADGIFDRAEPEAALRDLSVRPVVPTANGSALNIGTMALDAWFQGGIGKVAIYGTLLTQTQIVHHFQVMTGKQPTGSCQDTCTL